MAIRLDSEFDVGPAFRVRRYVHNNGLVVLAAPNHAAPIISVQTWFRVGSRHETPGATGLAHLFEHLMFGATARHPAGDFDRIVESSGGESNAATWVDWTYYRLTVPARDLELALQLESDRMQGLTLDPDAVEAERDVVTNERRERVEDDVDGWLDEQLLNLAYTSHPYRWPTIGWMADIRQVSLATINAFYRAWYGPNNAVLVVAGDFTEATLLDLVETYYGHLAPVQLPVGTTHPEPAQTAERRMRAPKPLSTHRVLLGYHVPGQAHPDWAVLEIISVLLAGCPSARLYRRLVVELEYASSVDAQLTPFAHPSLLRLAVTCTRGHTAEAVLELVDAALAELCETGCTPAELATAQNLAEAEFWSNLVDSDGKAEALGHHEVTLGDAANLPALATRLLAVSVADVQRVAQTYLRTNNRAIVIADPDGAEADDEAESDA